jgi:hypothetical protein
MWRVSYALKFRVTYNVTAVPMLLGVAGAMLVCAAAMFMFVGTVYFPQVDSGQTTLDVRAPGIFRDFGTSAELRGGLKGGERPVPSPPAGLAHGSKVQVAEAPAG